MDIIQAMINLVLIPVIAVYIENLRQHKELKYTADFYCRYVIAIVVNLFLAKSMAQGIFMYTGYYFAADRVGYTACAFVAALIQPIFWEAWKRFKQFAIVEKGSKQN